MALSIPIRSRLGDDRETVLTGRETVRSTTLTNRRKRWRTRRIIRRRQLIGRGGRRIIRRRVRNCRTPRIVEGKRRQGRRRTSGIRRRRGRRTRRRRWHRSRRGRIRRRNRRDGGWCIRKEKKREIIHRVCTRGGTRIERTRLIKRDVTRDAHPTTNGVPTAIALMLITVSEKNTLNRLSGQFGAFARRQKDIADATK
jgi:hypothetical protein